MIRAILLLIFFFLPSFSHAATFYYWVENGVINLTDDYEKVPSAYRNQVQRKVMEDVQEKRSPVLSSTPRTAPQKVQMKEGGTLGFRDESPIGNELQWEEQLKNSSEGYETVNKEYLKESDKLIERRYGSHQQFKSTVLGMAILREDRSKYEAKLIEAKEMLKKISGEAEKSSSSLPLGSLYAVGTERDIHGRDETWWRQKAFSQKEQVKEAIDHYEKVYKLYNEGIDKLGPARFGGISLTQYQMISNKLSILKGEIERYQVQITEAEEGLKKLIKEAEESGADIEWLK